MVNFNAAPYFDDYDENKGFYKILFRPSVAVQARELNQMQTILQKQIERFGSHIFKEGSIAIGGAFDDELTIPYVKALTTGLLIPTGLSSNLDDVRNNFVGKLVIGQNSGVQAVVRAVEYDGETNNYVFMIRYTAGSGDDSVFRANEPVVYYSFDETTQTYTQDASYTFTTIASDATGNGSIFSIGKGAIFFRGYFVAFPTQTIVLEKYSNTPSAAIGIKFTESIVTEINDPTLLDNALGSYNENAPGAHRYKFDPVLVKLPYGGGTDDPDFVLLLSVKNGVIEEKNERPQYNIIRDELAKRTFDESGDYYVKGLSVITREHLDDGSNEGLYTAAQGGNNELISIDIDPGTAYVKGYEVNFTDTQHIVTEKSTEFAFVNESSTNARTGGYVLIKEISGSPILDTGTVIQLYGVAQNRVTDKEPLVTSFPTSIGTARVKGLVYESGTLGTAAAQMRLYLYDINLPSNAFNSVKAVGISGEFFADVVLFSGVPTIFDQNQDKLLFYVGSDYVKSLKNEGGQSDTNFYFQKTSDGGQTNLNFNGGSTGNVNISFTSEYESLGYSSGPLSTAEKREIILTLKSGFEVVQQGTVEVAANTVTGIGTLFQSTMLPGEVVKINSTNYTIYSITSETSMVLTTSGTVNAGNAISRVFLPGDVIDLTRVGSTNTQRTAEVNNDILTIDIKERNSTVSSVPIRVSYKAKRVATIKAEIDKILKKDVYVRINCTSLPTVSDPSAPIPIGLPDVFKLKQVLKRTGGNFTAGNIGTGTDVTDQFTLDNGQRDNLYDHARIIPVNGKVINTSSDYLLVKVDHFESDFSTGFGYFSIDSYPIDDTGQDPDKIYTRDIPTYKTTSGESLFLANYLDFRPYKANTAVSTTVIGSSTINPAYSASGNLKVDANGLRLPVPDSIINLDYSYYLARRDAVVLDKQGNLSLIKGQPAAYPISPNIPDNVMGIARVYIAPYPSITEKLARILKIKNGICVSNQIANIRYTMREIGVLKNRIENLEYYNALNLLEKSTKDLLIIDPLTKEDRFKNGFFVDSFVDHSLGASGRSDYNIAVDKAENVIRPVFELDSFRYNFVTSLSSGVQKTGNIITLPYSEVVLIDQPNVTTTRNIEQSVYRFVGNMSLVPDGDVWVDETTVDKIVDPGNLLPTEKIITTEWDAWSNYVTSYNVYNRAKGDRSLLLWPGNFLKSFSSLAEAEAWALANDKDQRFLIETAISQKATGIQTTVTQTKNPIELGNFVTDASLIPYIRPQIIRIFIQGLKASTRYYPFFDGVDMSEYITPATVVDGRINDTILGAEGSNLRSDSLGDILCFLRLPADGKRFRTGTKEIVVTDSPTNNIDATSYSKGYFTAQGLNVQKQNTILSTVPKVDKKIVSELRKISSTVEIYGASCMAYSFKVDVPAGEEGVFLTSVDVFIESMHPTLGVWFEIRELDSAGGITRNQVPNSEVWMRRDDSRIRLNPYDADRDYITSPLIPTNINFPSPIFLYNDTQYAFVIHTEGLNPDTYFYISRLGENDLRTGEQITSRRLTGTLYTTNNNLNWVPEEDVDLTVRFNRANFTIGSGTVGLGNRPTEFFTIQNPSGTFGKLGEVINGSDKITYSNYESTGNTIAVDDKVVGSTSGVTGVIRAISGSNLFTDGFGFTNNETISITNSSDVAKNITAKISKIDTGQGTLRKYNTQKNQMILDDSNGLFFNNCKIKGAFTANTADLTAFNSWPYSTINLKPNYLSFTKTSILFEQSAHVGTGTSGSQTGYIGAAPDDNSSYDTEVLLLSRYNELNSFGGNPSSRIRATMSTTSNYVSPVLDVARANAIYVHNIINNPIYGANAEHIAELNAQNLDLFTELLPSGGQLINKYISRTITLANNQDAEDLIVKLTAYRPPGSTIRVWMKIRSNEDGTPFDQRPWIEMTYTDAFSSKANEYNYIEIDYNVDPAYLDAGGIVQYTSGGITYKTFKQFAVKIGLMGVDSAIVPKVNDVRAIALQR